MTTPYRTPGATTGPDPIADPDDGEAAVLAALPISRWRAFIFGMGHVLDIGGMAAPVPCRARRRSHEDDAAALQCNWEAVTGDLDAVLHHEDEER